MDDTHQRISHLLNEAHRLSGTINERAAALERQRAADHAMVERATTALRQCQEKLQRVEGELQKVRSEYSMLERLRTYDLDRCANAHGATLRELADTKNKLARWENTMPCGHPEVALVVDDPPHCGVCDLLQDCKALTFRRLQDEQRPWVAHNFPNHDSQDPLLGAVEELGELAHAHMKLKQGIRGTPTELVSAAKDAIADMVIYLADYCTARGFDFQSLVEETWTRVKSRDWKADPVTGGSGELSRRQEDELSAQREKDRYTGGTHANC